MQIGMWWARAPNPRESNSFPAIFSGSDTSYNYSLCHSSRNLHQITWESITDSLGQIEWQNESRFPLKYMRRYTIPQIKQNTFQTPWACNSAISFFFLHKIHLKNIVWERAKQRTLSIAFVRFALGLRFMFQALNLVFSASVFLISISITEPTIKLGQMW